MHFVFITGGVASSLGKGIASAALATLLKSRNFRVRIRKLDPYLNVDPGTMSPYQHGEVYVTDDGAETDLDLGHYERFTNQSAKQTDSISSGKIYSNVLSKERKGDYLGATIQVIPHVTNEIKSFINSDIKNEDIIIYEIGGTVGDIESLPFLEAIRQIRNNKKISSALIHMTYIPYLSSADELKTKPTQHSVKELRSIGIQPDFLLCRAEREIPSDLLRKIAVFCNVPGDQVFQAVDMDSIYKIPLMLHQQGLDQSLVDNLNIWARSPDLREWYSIIERLDHPKQNIKIAIVGKYTDVVDSYKSIEEALVHAGISNEAAVSVVYVAAQDVIAKGPSVCLEGVDGVIVPGGFGERGTEGMIRSIEFARCQNLPFLGICLGMQLASVEVARNILGLHTADSLEFAPETTEPVIFLMEEQKGVTNKGGTMRLGSYPCVLAKSSKAREAYGKDTVMERHRHRYEFNSQYRSRFEEAGVVFSGTSPDDKLVEIFELQGHPWFVACQFHPELVSRPMGAHPLFKGFVFAASKKKQDKKSTRHTE
ncbi:MAG: CTP synthetase [Zetaproteobacteria bacterium]|nr:CTP synthetase [Pseudobdellovibrionaceae bacterium]